MRVHISLPVTNLESSVSFYAALFGQDVTKRRTDYANFRLDEPAIHLALNERAGVSVDTSDEVNHFGIEVQDMEELGRVRARLIAAGLAHRDETEAVCCYATGEKVWTRDPDGHTWEVWVRTGEADVMHSPSNTCCTPAAEETKPASSCC